MCHQESKTEKIFEQNIDAFTNKVDSVRQHASILQQHVGEVASPQREDTMLLQALENLQNALEELRIAEEELKEQNEQLAIARTVAETERQRYQDLFEFAPDGYLVTDDAGIVQEANCTVAQLLNIPKQFLIRKPMINFIPNEERRTFRTKFNQLFQSELIQEWELPIQPRNRAILDAAVTVSPVRDLQGKPVGWRWLLRDITVRKQTEEKLRNIILQNMQLQEAAKLKSHFLAIMSHELRSPMNAIIGFSQMLLRQPHQPLAKSQENMVERILRNGRNLLTLIDDVLDYSRIEVGALQLQLEELNLAELVTATTEEMRSLAKQKSLELQVNLSLQNVFILNDSTRLRQILVNLLSNAIKFTDTGSVQVEASELPEDLIEIAVKDTGIGIANADIEHIFKEFRQVNQTITRRHGGTGLGLAIVDKLVQMMQGKIVVESNLDRGSIFRIQLPRQVRKGT